MNTHADYVGRCIDGGIFIVFGIITPFIVSHRVKKKLQAGTIAEAKAKKLTMGAWLFAIAAVALGLSHIFVQ